MTLDNWLFPATVSNKSNTETNPADLISGQNTKSQARLLGPLRAGKGFCTNFAGRKGHFEY